MTTIVLSMIVKNEARVIARCLASLKPRIQSWAIVDTGSTDGTQDVIRRELAGIPGKIVDLPWKGFAGSRNDALQLAREVGGDYFLTLDADEVLVWPEGHDIASKLTDDVYGIRFRLPGGESTWQRTLLGRLSLPWRWIGDMDECLDCGNETLTKCLITGAHVDSYTDGGRAKKRAHSVFDHLPPGSGICRTRKCKEDALVLEEMSASDPTDPRAVFYLAQRYTGAREIDKAIATYEKRAGMGGFAEEVFYSLFQLAGLIEARGDDWRKVAEAHLRAYQVRPTRAEPLWALAVLYNDRNQPAVAEIYARAAMQMPRPNDSILVMESVYEYRAADELAAALGKLGRFDEALGILEMLLVEGKLPALERERAQENVAFIREIQAESRAA